MTINEDENEDNEMLTWENIQENEVYKGIIVDIKTHEVMICLSPTIYGIVIPQECSINVNINMDLLHNFSYLYILFSYSFSSPSFLSFLSTSPS